ncbi:hypothetical protein CC80DRAFT_26349 [Byssothecium circinans]|uniref:Uncharacterized protein n=1 Tax=Byssothecium circinans TaxID=147558 RepID=A0A6A5U0M6_9PLEO|nr:hypothetical protein CC80DRAFT_26349 [Byssothecium circinans]
MRSHSQLEAGPVFDRVNSSVAVLIGLRFARLPPLIIIYIAFSSSRGAVWVEEGFNSVVDLARDNLWPPHRAW